MTNRPLNSNRVTSTRRRSASPGTWKGSSSCGEVSAAISVARKRPLGVTRASNGEGYEGELFWASPPHWVRSSVSAKFCRRTLRPLILRVRRSVLRGLAPVGPLLDRNRRRPHRRTQREDHPHAQDDGETDGGPESRAPTPYVPRGVLPRYARPSRNRARTHSLPPTLSPPSHCCGIRSGLVHHAAVAHRRGDQVRRAVEGNAATPGTSVHGAGGVGLPGRARQVAGDVGPSSRGNPPRSGSKASAVLAGPPALLRLRGTLLLILLSARRVCGRLRLWKNLDHEPGVRQLHCAPPRSAPRRRSHEHTRVLVLAQVQQAPRQLPFDRRRFLLPRDSSDVSVPRRRYEAHEAQRSTAFLQLVLVVSYRDSERDPDGDDRSYAGEQGVFSLGAPPLVEVLNSEAGLRTRVARLGRLSSVTGPGRQVAVPLSAKHRGARTSAVGHMETRRCRAGGCP